MLDPGRSRAVEDCPDQNTNNNGTMTTTTTRVRPVPWLAPAAGLVLLAPTLGAQSPAFQSPGSPWGGGFGQTTRFDNEFNPAISFTVDTLAEHTWFDGATKDGFNLSLRRFDVLAAAWVDPDAWAYAAVAYHDGGELALEEAALEYVGLPGNHTLRVGRFFVDFGKQMQMHTEELRTVDRPLVLRTYLGEELGGEGVMWNHFTTVGEESLVRYSLGIFQSLLPHAHAHGDTSSHVEADRLLDDRSQADELNFTARLTGMRDVGERGTLQFGGSARWIPSFTYRAVDGDTTYERKDLSNAVYGLDLTYGWVADSGIETWTLGGEWLLQDGDLNGHVHSGELEVLQDRIQGLYGFADYKWSLTSAAGVQYGLVQMPEAGKPRTAEYDAYYTHWFSEFLRLRFAVTYLDARAGEDSVRLALQLTGVVGPHSHGVNW